MLNPNQHNHRYYLRKNFVHSCTLPSKEKETIEEYFTDPSFLTKKFISLCLVSTDISRRQIYSKSYKALEKERRKHMKNHKYIIHPFSDFSFYWELLMILVFFVQQSFTPVLIILSRNMISCYDLILATQFFSCVNILVSCSTGHYRQDIKEVILDRKRILWYGLKSGNLIIYLIGGIPLSYISKKYGASLLTQRLLSCCISFNVFPLLRYLEIIRQKRGYSFIIFRMLDAFLIFIFGTTWLTVLIYVGACIDRKNQHMNVQLWFWVYNTYKFMYGNEITDFCFVGFEFFFSTIAIIFGILIRCVLIVILVITFSTWKSTENKRASLFKELNEFCHHKRLPYDLKKRLVKYYKFKLHNEYYNETEIKNQLSENLKYNIKDYISRAWFEADIFKLCPLALRQLITMNLDEDIYFKNDVIYRCGDDYEHIYFIKSGSIWKINESTSETHEVAEGNFFSEKALLPTKPAPHTKTVVAIEPCQLFKLSRENFFKIIQNYQSSYATILDILETRKNYLYRGMRLKSGLKLGDYYQASRRYTDIE